MKMKNLTSLVLVFLILETRTGFALNVHYCEHKIAFISMAHNPSDCGMKMVKKKETPLKTSISKTPCCKDTIQLFQNQEPQKKEVNFINSYKVYKDGVLPITPKMDLIYIPDPSEAVNWNPPPPNNNNILLLNHCFVFYG
jgi:hypothetical protein